MAWMCFCPRLRGSGTVLKPAFCFRSRKEAPQKLPAFLPRLVRDGFLQRRVLGVEEFDQDLQHLERRRLARLVAGEDFLWVLPAQLWGASGLLLAGTPGAGRVPAAGGEMCGERVLLGIASDMVTLLV